MEFSEYWNIWTTIIGGFSRCRKIVSKRLLFFSHATLLPTREERCVTRLKTAVLRCRIFLRKITQKAVINIVKQCISNNFKVVSREVRWPPNLWRMAIGNGSRPCVADIPLWNLIVKSSLVRGMTAVCDIRHSLSIQALATSLRVN